MQSSSRILSAGAALLCAALASPVAAHHSFSSLFDMKTNTEIEGRIAKINWVNPHIRIYVAARDGQTWEVEAGPVNLLSRMKIEKSMLKVGETIRVWGQSSDGIEVVLNDGRRLFIPMARIAAIEAVTE